MSVSQIVSINPATDEINATFEPTSARNVDRALELTPRIRNYLCQDRAEDANLESSIRCLAELLAC